VLFFFNPLGNRVGRPDQRTFSDPRYYSEVLLEVVARGTWNESWRSEPPTLCGCSVEFLYPRRTGAALCGIYCSTRTLTTSIRPEGPLF